MNQLRSNASHAHAIAQLAARFTSSAVPPSASLSFHASAPQLCHAFSTRACDANATAQAATHRVNQHAHATRQFFTQAVQAEITRQAELASRMTSTALSPRDAASQSPPKQSQQRDDARTKSLALQEEWRAAIHSLDFERSLQCFLTLQPHTDFSSHLDLRSTLHRNVVKSYILTRDHMLVQLLLYAMDQYLSGNAKQQVGSSSNDTKVFQPSPTSHLSHTMRRLSAANEFTEKFDLFRDQADDSREPFDQSQYQHAESMREHPFSQGRWPAELTTEATGANPPQTHIHFTESMRAAIHATFHHLQFARIAALFAAPDSTAQCETAINFRVNLESLLLSSFADTFKIARLKQHRVKAHSYHSILLTANCLSITTMVRRSDLLPTNNKESVDSILNLSMQRSLALSRYCAALWYSMPADGVMATPHTLFAVVLSHEQSMIHLCAAANRCAEDANKVDSLRCDAMQVLKSLIGVWEHSADFLVFYHADQAMRETMTRPQKTTVSSMCRTLSALHAVTQFRALHCTSFYRDMIALQNYHVHHLAHLETTQDLALLGTSNHLCEFMVQQAREQSLIQLHSPTGEICRIDKSKEALSRSLDPSTSDPESISVSELTSVEQILNAILCSTSVTRLVALWQRACMLSLIDIQAMTTPAMQVIAQRECKIFTALLQTLAHLSVQLEQHHQVLNPPATESCVTTSPHAKTGLAHLAMTLVQHLSTQTCSRLRLTPIQRTALLDCIAHDWTIPRPLRTQAKTFSRQAAATASALAGQSFSAQRASHRELMQFLLVCTRNGCMRHDMESATTHDLMFEPSWHAQSTREAIRKIEIDQAVQSSPRSVVKAQRQLVLQVASMRERGITRMTLYSHKRDLAPKKRGQQKIKAKVKTTQ